MDLENIAVLRSEMRKYKKTGFFSAWLINSVLTLFDLLSEDIQGLLKSPTGSAT